MSRVPLTILMHSQAISIYNKAKEIENEDVIFKKTYFTNMCKNELKQLLDLCNDLDLKNIITSENKCNKEWNDKFTALKLFCLDKW